MTGRLAISVMKPVMTEPERRRRVHERLHRGALRHGRVRSDLAQDHPDHEVCDDGNRVSSDGCLNNCVPARCDDGIRRDDRQDGQWGYEACDDGESVGG